MVLNIDFMQDNDPKHVSHRAKQFFEENNINWWHTPPESPDLNPIENLWHELKDYLREEVKPGNLAELNAGIKSFWSTVTKENCFVCINHLNYMVMQLAIELFGLYSHSLLLCTHTHKHIYTSVCHTAIKLNCLC